MKKFKKIILNISLGLFTGALQAQQVQELNFGDLPKPVPSVSSLSTYVNTPTSIATGIPEISFSLVKIPTVNKNLVLDVSLSYHVGNVNPYEAAGEVGTGWSLIAGGVISRQINNDLDEKYDNTAAGNYQKNRFDDVYFYSFPGGSGKFKIIRDINTNTFSLENLSPNKLKIEYVKDNSNTATLILNSFTITDEKGYKYYFNDYSISTISTHLLNRKEYKSAFFLTKITDANNIELAGFTYQKDSKYNSTSSQLLYKTCKLKTIESNDIGTIVFDYTYDNLENTMNDPYSLTAVSLKDKSGSLITKHLFEYTFFGYVYGTENQSKRVLLNVKKINRNSSVIEKTGFQYDTSGSETIYQNNPDYPYGIYLCQNPYPDPKEKTFGILKRIVLPTGGVTEYNYESNQTFIDKNMPSYLQDLENSFFDPDIQFVKPKEEINFDTQQNMNYTFNVTGNSSNLPKPIYLYFQIDQYYQSPYLDPSNSLYLDFSLKQNGQTMDRVNLCEGTTDYSYYALTPGTYTIQINGTGGKGHFTLYDVGKISPPYKNVSNAIEGVRISKIRSYESTVSAQPQKVTQYEYNEFSNPNNSSGYSFSSEDNGATSSVYLPYVLYKNVKVTDGDGGYTKYYFKLPSDYPYTDLVTNTVDYSYVPFYNLTRKGILDKLEAYNAQNQKVSSKQFDYTFEKIPNAPEYIVYGQAKSWPSWIKSSGISEKTYDVNTSGFIENKIENVYSPFNYELSYVKETSSDGSIVEKQIKYAMDKGNTSLTNANIIAVPLEIETKNNSKTVEKVETKYDNPSIFAPSAQIAINVNDGSQAKLATYDAYDTKGNVEQYTVNIDASGIGTPITIIWGYDKTLPIAKIEGAKLSDIGTLAGDIITKSNADKDAASETSLINALDTFRSNAALKNFAITTYTYDPLVGVTTVTPPNGMREIYKYDMENKVKSITDVNGNIIKEYKYNTKP
ncbi:hypothetical protein [Chryseobacterium nepalense]|uniref:hypothetical protein n=1 Tax=Chryseobacterium nepalense TaxID=1854498 RepID=UPI002E0AFBF1|nr:hypothetical protein [Chryseobacterium nepalense]